MLDEAFLDGPVLGGDAGGFFEEIEAVGAALLVIEDGEGLVGVGLGDGEGEGFVELLAGEFVLLVAQVGGAEADEGEGLIRGEGEGVLELGDGEAGVAFGEFEAAEVDVHAGAVAAILDGAFEEGALVVPVGIAQQGAAAEEESPEGEDGDAGGAGDGKPGGGKEGGQEQERAGDVEPVLGDAGIEGEEAADGKIGDDEADEAGEYGWVAAASPAHPEEEGGEEDRAEEGLEFAVAGDAKRCGEIAAPEGEDVAFHVKANGGDEEAGVFREGAEGDDGPRGPGRGERPGEERSAPPSGAWRGWRRR